MIPDRPLNFRPADLELGDYFWLDEFMAPEAEIKTADMRRLVDVLAGASDWSREELGHVRISELAVVFEAIRGDEEVEAEKAVPLAIASSSSSGPAETGASYPAGPPSAT